jgi:hypothetical protein
VTSDEAVEKQAHEFLEELGAHRVEVVFAVVGEEQAWSVEVQMQPEAPVYLGAGKHCEEAMASVRLDVLVAKEAPVPKVTKPVKVGSRRVRPELTIPEEDE